jgi:inner membrane protein
LEPLTHFLFGGVLARAGLGRKSALATATLVLAAEAPDLDVLSRFGGGISGFAHHRGITHTFIGAPFVAGLVVLVLYLGYVGFGRRRWAPGKPPPRWGMLYGLAFLSILGHILLDFTNSYGVRPFEPFSYRWYSWDIVFIVEPVLWIVLLGGLLAPPLLQRLAGNSRASDPARTRRVAAIVALLLVAAFWGLCDRQHREALAVVGARAYAGELPGRVSAFPYPIDPFQWYGLAETREVDAAVIVHTLDRAGSTDHGPFSTYRKPAASPAVLAAERCYLGRVFLDWAQYPIAEVESLDAGQPGYLVRFYDLRYLYPGSPRRTLGGWVQLDGAFRVVRQDFGPR